MSHSLFLFFPLLLLLLLNNPLRKTLGRKLPIPRPRHGLLMLFRSWSRRRRRLRRHHGSHHLFFFACDLYLGDGGGDGAGWFPVCTRKNLSPNHPKGKEKKKKKKKSALIESSREKKVEEV
ncbi:hypothetical protein QBC44DRAFT_329842, partial [Cladorrhinum sp. PSN332]